jgi:hypothetical protein
VSVFIQALPYILGALAAVTIIDTVGAWASRILNFNYGYLSILSFAAYILLGYFMPKQVGFSVVVLAGLLVGFYDATIGLKLSHIFKANTRMTEEELQKFTTSFALALMLFLSPVLVGIGYLLR